MKYFLNKLRSKSRQLLIVGLLATLTQNASLGQVVGYTNNLASWLSDRSIIWSTQTNGFWTGVCFSQNNPQQPITVYALSSNKTEGLVYVLPPSDKFERLELRDTNGVIIPTDKKGNAGGLLPQRISASDLPSGSYGVFRGHGVDYHYFPLAQGAAADFREFSISDFYRIKKESDYLLSVCPVIYKFEPDRKYLDRVDLPSVTTKVHLVPPE